MQLGYAIPNNQGVAKVSDLVALAGDAERLGFHSVWVSEHLFSTAYVAKRLGNRPYHEALTVLTAVAAATSKVYLGTSVLVLPWHHPVRLAKMLASLDHFAEGRLILGAGVGVTRDEYAALGVSFERRGKIADECLAAMRALWDEALPTFAGEYYAFSNQLFSPKPVEKGGPPIWIGGNSPAAQRRLIKFGTGWHPLALSPMELGEALPRLQAQLVAAGRSPNIPVALRTTLEFTDQPWDRPVAERRTLKGTTQELLAMLQAYQAAGATHLIVDPNSGDVSYNREILTRISEQLTTPLSR